MIRVAQILGKMNGGGAEQVVMNYYSAIDREQVQFDFYLFKGSKFVPVEEIKSMGGRLFVLPTLKHPLKYLKTLRRLLSENKYDIMHCHLSTLSFLPLLAGKQADVRTRILHNHSTSGGAREWHRNLAKLLFKPFAKLYATDYFACSEHAARWMYGHVPVIPIGENAPKGAAIVLRNAIDTEKFRFSEQKRKQIRKEFNVKPGTLLFGNVGRFCPQKNQHFLIDVFSQIAQQHGNSALILAGIGKDMDVIRARVTAAGLSDRVIFAGQRADIDSVYSAMDCFILPSNYEGLGMAGIEAQCAGLHCLFSDRVPPEVKVTPNAQFLSLKTSAHDWAFAAINLAGLKRRDLSGEVAAAGYDICGEARKLAEFYLRKAKL